MLIAALLRRRNRSFAASHPRGTKSPRWRAKVALGQDKQKTYFIGNGNFLCLSCPSATFALQHGSFVPREWLAAKGLSEREMQNSSSYSRPLFSLSPFPLLTKQSTHLNYRRPNRNLV